MRKLAACMLLLLVAPATDAHAQAQGDAKKEAKEKKVEEKKTPERKDAGPADASAEPHDLPKPAADPEKDRAQRRQRAVSYVRSRWGALLSSSAAQAELRLHARRIARIDAMEAVAKGSGKTALLPRIARLREKETARFEKRMEWIRDGKDGAP